jgi:hypothetical protein
MRIWFDGCWIWVEGSKKRVSKGPVSAPSLTVGLLPRLGPGYSLSQLYEIIRWSIST